MLEQKTSGNYLKSLERNRLWITQNIFYSHWLNHVNDCDNNENNITTQHENNIRQKTQ